MSDSIHKVDMLRLFELCLSAERKLPCFLTTNTTSWYEKEDLSDERALFAKHGLEVDDFAELLKKIQFESGSRCISPRMCDFDGWCSMHHGLVINDLYENVMDAVTSDEEYKVKAFLSWLKLLESLVPQINEFTGRTYFIVFHLRCDDPDYSASVANTHAHILCKEYLTDAWWSQHRKKSVSLEFVIEQLESRF